MNRAWRRMIRFGKDFSQRRSQGRMQNREDDLFKASTPQDVTSVRAKNARKGKVTADKWNQ
jgi:hypothetical protein